MVGAFSAAQSCGQKSLRGLTNQNRLFPGRSLFRSNKRVDSLPSFATPPCDPRKYLCSYPSRRQPRHCHIRRRTRPASDGFHPVALIPERTKSLHTDCPLVSIPRLDTAGRTRGGGVLARCGCFESLSPSVRFTMNPTAATGSVPSKGRQVRQDTNGAERTPRPRRAQCVAIARFSFCRERFAKNHHPRRLTTVSAKRFDC